MSSKKQNTRDLVADLILQNQTELSGQDRREDKENLRHDKALSEEHTQHEREADAIYVHRCYLRRSIEDNKAILASLPDEVVELVI